MNFDEYVYPGTNVLKNKLDIRKSIELEVMERMMIDRASSELITHDITGRFDASHLKSIHKTLFGELYDWAGEFREIQIYKGGTEFTAPEDITREIDAFCESIEVVNYFHGMSKDDTANALADAMVRLNRIHPFREGNGRCQRMFMEQLALNAGFDLDFRSMSENEMRDASFHAAHGNRDLMRYLFRSNMVECDMHEHIVEAPKTVSKRPFVVGRLVSLMTWKPVGKDDDGLEFD